MKNSVEIADRKAEIRKRCQEIVDTCKAEIREMTEEEEKEFNDCKEEIKSLNEELKELKEKLGEYEKENDEVQTENEEVKNKRSNINIMNKEFRLLSAIKSIANNQPLDEVSAAVVNAGAEEMRKCGLAFGGQIQLPTEARTIAVTGTTAEGEDLVGTDIFEIEKPLRAKNVLVGAGAKYLSGLVGNVQIPVMDKSNVAWEGEVATATSGDPTFTHVTLTPHRLTAYVDISKQLLNQDSICVEAAIREDIVNAINDKLEATILGVATGATQPNGLGSYTGVTSGTVATYADVVDAEASIEENNVYGDMCYIVSPKAKAKFRCLSYSGKTTAMVMQGEQIDGTKSLSTSNVASKKFYYGDFSKLAIGQWGAVDLTVDPFTKAADGCIRLVINAYFDAVPVREEAFFYGNFD